MPGRDLLQIPGPSNVPRRVLEALARPTIDHRGPEFAAVALKVHADLARLLGTADPVVLYPASGTGAWEAALVNTLSPGDRVLVYETGHFAAQWARLAARLGLDVATLASDWTHGARADVIAGALRADASIRAVCVVHNETSTGAVSDVAAVRRALDDSGHEALLMVDTVSSVGSLPYDHDGLGVDVTVGASQKGLMLPPGLSFNAVSARALEAHRTARLPRAYWDWSAMLEGAGRGSYPYTPASNLVVALSVSLPMLLDEEGMDAVLARHRRLAAAARACVEAWGLEQQCRALAERSDVVTAVRLPDGFDADAVRATVLDRFGVSLGNGLGRLAGRVFRIGHLGDFNETMLAGALSAVESGLRLHQVPLAASGLPAALESLAADGGGAAG